MRTVPAREIKRRGISAVDDALKEGPVHVSKSGRLKYVILSEERDEAYLDRVKASLEDWKAGRARRVTAQGLIDELNPEH